MSSPGQIIGGIAGAAIGFFLGTPILGAQIGLMVGGAIDPPKGPSITGPRLEDLSVQTSTYGAPLPRGYGTVCVSGNIFWLEGDQIKETTTTEQQGGKGGGGQEVTTYHYSATFAVGLMHVPDGATVSLRRLWLDTDIVYEAGSSNAESIIASNNASVFTFYDGSDDQLPNPRMQADKGANNVSAYPGLCYLVFEDLSLEKYSNTLLRAQVKVELVIGSSTPTNAIYGPVYDSQTVSTQLRQIASVEWLGDALRYVISRATTVNDIPYEVAFYTDTFGESVQSATVTVADTFGAPYTWTSPALVAAVDTDEPIAIYIQERQGSETQRLRFITPASDQYSPSYVSGELDYSGGQTCAHGNGETFISWGPITKFVGIYYSCKTSGTYSIVFMGLSENYLFGVKRDTSGTQTTVYKFSRADLSLVDTYVANVPDGAATIQVIDDDNFYTAANGAIYRWQNGAVIDQLNALTNIDGTPTHATPIHASFAVINEAPAFGYYIFQTSDATLQNIEYFYSTVPATAAKLRTIVQNECALAGIDSADLDLTALTNSDVRGFRVAQRGAVRNSLEPLQAAYPFDVAQSGYKIKFVSRGGASVASIPEQDLAASDGQPGVLLPVAREMGSQLPFRVAIRYTDPDREYDIGEQAVERYEKDSLNERVMELPLSLTSGEAIQMADVLLAKEWTERVEFGPFSLPPTWCHLEPSDVVTVTHRGQNYTIRLTRVEYLPDGRLVCNAKLTSAASYTSSATAQSPLVIGQSLVPLAGSSQMVLLDISRIDTAQDVAGMAAVMYGLASGWPGGALCRSDDQGQIWQAIASFNTKARVFTVAESASASTSYAVDSTTVITLTPIHSGATLYATTDDQLYAHTNLAAWGADGRWEICAFKTVVDNSGTYTVRDFLRGLYGSEWATGLHAAGDTLVMLDSSSIGFVGLPVSAIGSERQYKAVTQGQAIDAAATAKDTYGAINLKPIAPVDASGTVLSKQWTITASRRTRMPVEVFSGATVPLGESAESYDLELYDVSFSTLKRTFSGLTSMSATYTEAQQIADFGAAVTTIYGRWYQNSAVVGRGFPLQFSLTRNPANDPYADFVRLGMHFDGTDGSTTFTDVKGHTFTVSGTAKIATAQSKFGGASGIFGGSTGYIYTTEAIGNQDFCLECWGYFPSNAGSGYKFPIMQFGVNLDGTDGWLLARNGSDGALWVHNAYGNIIGTACPSSAWVHVAVFRIGSLMYLAVNGSVTTALGSLPNMASTTRLTIGTASVSWSQDHSFYLDEMRLVVGASVYSPSGFTPPTDAFYFG